MTLEQFNKLKHGTLVKLQYHPCTEHLVCGISHNRNTVQLESSKEYSYKSVDVVQSFSSM